MNICIAAEGYPAEGYPYYAFVENLCVEWAKQGNNVYVIAPQSISKILKGRPRLPYYSVHAIMMLQFISIDLFILHHLIYRIGSIIGCSLSWLL